MSNLAQNMNQAARGDHLQPYAFPVMSGKKVGSDGQASTSLNRLNSLKLEFEQSQSRNDNKELVVIQRDNGTHATMRLDLKDSLDQMLMRATQTEDTHFQHMLYEQAVFDAQDRIEENPMDTRALFVKAMALAEVGESEAALATYQQLIAIEPQDPMALNNAALMCEKMGDTDGALNYFQKSLEMEPSNTITRLNLAHFYEDHGNPEKVLEQLKLIHEDNNLNADEEVALTQYLEAHNLDSLDQLFDIHAANGLKDEEFYGPAHDSKKTQQDFGAGLMMGAPAAFAMSIFG